MGPGTSFEGHWSTIFVQGNSYPARLVSCCFSGIGQLFFLFVCLFWSLFVSGPRGQRKRSFLIFKKLCSFNIQTNN